MIKALKGEKGFVNGVYLKVRRIVLKQGHDPLGHVIVERVVRGEDRHIVFFDPVFDLVKRFAHLAKADGLRLPGEGNGATVIVGKNDNGPFSRLGIKDPFTGTVKGITVHQGDRHFRTLRCWEDTTPQMKSSPISSSPTFLL